MANEKSRKEKFGTKKYCIDCGTKLTFTPSGLKCQGCGRLFGKSADFGKDRNGRPLPKLPKGARLVRG